MYQTKTVYLLVEIDGLCKYYAHQDHAHK